jgi:hypothetical protein
VLGLQTRSSAFFDHETQSICLDRHHVVADDDHIDSLPGFRCSSVPHSGFVASGHGAADDLLQFEPFSLHIRATTANSSGANGVRNAAGNAISTARSAMIDRFKDSMCWMPSVADTSIADSATTDLHWFQIDQY